MRPSVPMSPQFKVHLTSRWGVGREGLVRLLRLSGAVFAFSVLGAVTASLAQSAPTASPSAPQSVPQSAPLRGFVPPYEILRTVRAAGFDPLAPPLRQGTSYVVRAIDFRGVAMRVVVDARSGAIRDANRIVSGPGLYGPYAPGPYPPAPYGRFGPPRYLAPADEFAAYGRPPYVGASEVPLSDQDALRGLAPARSQYSAGELAPALCPALCPCHGRVRPDLQPQVAAGLAAAGEKRRDEIGRGRNPSSNPTSQQAHRRRHDRSRYISPPARRQFPQSTTSAWRRIKKSAPENRGARRLIVTKAVTRLFDFRSPSGRRSCR